MAEIKPRTVVRLGRVPARPVAGERAREARNAARVPAARLRGRRDSHDRRDRALVSSTDRDLQASARARAS